MSNRDVATLHKDSLQALSHIGKQTPEKSRIVFVSGNFNIVHPGHLRLLRFAAECGDFLVVGVYDRTSRGALLDESLRLDSIKSIGFVNYAFILRDRPEHFVNSLRPAVVVKGKEHESTDNRELEVLQSYGGELLFSSGDLTFSSLDLLREEFARVNPSTISPPVDFPQRHGFEISDLSAALSRMKGLRVVVGGDTIVDEYVTCDALGMSQEDPTLVVTPLTREKYLGGAAIVAAHARGLGAEVHFFSVAGRDQDAAFIRERLAAYDVDFRVYEDESRPSTVKQRFRANNKTLLRVHQLRSHAISKDIRERINHDVAGLLDGIDLVIFSDFNHGCLPQDLVDNLTAECKEREIFMAADSQSSSQVGDVSRFREMGLIAPTEREARLAVQDFNSGLAVVAQRLQAKAECRNILMTLGSEGLLLYTPATNDSAWHTDRLPPFNTAPKDVAGAGDTLLVGASMGLCAGCNIWESAFLGSLAAAWQVGRIGNTPLKSENLHEEIGS